MMPALFIGHGSPMNAIADNSYTKMLNGLGKKFTRPKFILVVSAHWLTNGTFITAMKKPETIHDFGGFPRELFEVQYPAPGSPSVATLVQEALGVESRVQLEESKWGLDHGTWSVLRHLYPKADIPVLQLSINRNMTLQEHLELGIKLQKVRQLEGLIVGSGDIVHNLRAIKWEEDAKPFEWALEFDKLVQEKIKERDFNFLVNEFLDTEAGRLSVPTLDHYIPLLYVLGASTDEDELFFEYEEIQNGSISMTSFRYE
ncbi:4,5-DOPA dioxygenase extradiol [Bacteriovorax sp. Seq25_V]|uniref:4,5-DOPA-extradiol-dioxygenase n=1 Tax=Bacteriovorax sp. Seq25_V TaxID=1201288 RepID=UPI0004248A61|nr:4,5-DOPA dioxygenase extradiol [Bacteriovorax sp. Seq25_V]